ncbi:MAG: A/G-specific adenine glycosylase [Planctomycetota bacterium]|jgi:A/G-specific adenine glycosylase
MPKSKPKKIKATVSDPKGLSQIAKLAVEWFSKHRRDLPWRKTKDAYRIWISECMLQQTQVATVIPYYDRFLKRFPDVGALAAAELDEVYQLWAGLGYYRRARQLHSAAIRVVESGQAPFPTDRDAIAKLPGVGRYTANAIASFAYDQPFGIVEANTQRLYARLMLCKEPLSQTAAQTKLWDFSQSLVEAWPVSPGLLNASLMEIGALICKPKDPQCHACPLQSHCQAHQTGQTSSIPTPKPKKLITDLREIGLLVRNSKRQWLLRRRSSTERWSGLWDFPRYDCTNHESETQAIEHALKEFHRIYGKSLSIQRECLSVKHSVTRYRILLRCFEASLETARTLSARSKLAADEQFDWYQIDELESLALSSSARKVADWLKRHYQVAR